MFEPTPQGIEADKTNMKEQQNQEIVSDFAIYRYKNLYTVIHEGAVFDGLSSTNAKSDYAGLYDHTEKGGFDEFYIRVKSINSNLVLDFTKISKDVPILSIEFESDSKLRINGKFGNISLLYGEFSIKYFIFNFSSFTTFFINLLLVNR